MLVATGHFPYNGAERSEPIVEQKHQSPSEIQRASQQDLADKLNVVRQTISKWEQGLSIPDSNLLIAACVGILAVAAILAAVNSPYLGWDYSAPETAVMGVAIHAFEWGFIRLAPFALIAALVGVFLTRKKA